MATAAVAAPMRTGGGGDGRRMLPLREVTAAAREVAAATAAAPGREEPSEGGGSERALHADMDAYLQAGGYDESASEGGDSDEGHGLSHPPGSTRLSEGGRSRRS